MVYDNTKFYEAFDKWLEHNVELGFGEHYAGELLADFCEFCRETRMMKRSPGRVVFGKRLKEKGFDNRKLRGLTFWSGLELKNPRNYDPMEWAQSHTKEKIKTALIEQQIAQRERALAESPDARAAELERFHKELDEEERKLKELEDGSGAQDL